MSFFAALTYKPGTNTTLPLTKILVSDKSAYSWFSRTRVLSHGGYTYIGVSADFGTNYRSGLLRINETTNAAQKISLSSVIEEDDHNEAAIVYSSVSSKYISAYCKHSTDKIIRWRTSDDGLTWAVEQTYTSAGFVTYAALFEDVSNNIYLMYRSFTTGPYNGGWYYKKSTDGGVTFGGEVHWLDIFNGASYPIMHQDNSNKNIIHVISSEFPYSDFVGTGNNVSYGYFDLSSDTFYDGQGNSNAVLPVSMPTDGHVLFTADTASGQECWLEDLGLDSNNYPRVLFTVTENTPSPNWGPIKKRYYTEWNGSTWSTPYNMGEYQSVWSEIPEEGTNIQRNVFTDPSNIVSSPEYSSVGRFNDRDADQMFIHKQVGSKTELFKVVRNASNDFTWTQLTFGSTYHQWRANSIPSGPYNLYWLNARDYRDMKHYDMDLYIGIL